jgi:uncharacterized oxidoreductase
MNISGNTILITGGTSGIGFELAAELLKLGNTVIMTGRDQRRLEETQQKLPGVHTFQSDVSDPSAIPVLFEAVIKKFPALNVLINNAGIMRKLNLQDRRNETQNGGANALQDIGREIETNLLGPIRMVQQFLPHLKVVNNAAIVNVTSGLAFVPLPIAPIYCATKAGLHSFTQSLRVQLKNTSITVFELAPPATQTPLLTTEGFTPKDMKGAQIMDLHKMVAVAIDGLKNDRLEIRPGQSNILKLMSRIAPQFILNQLSKSVDPMLAQTSP